jgi:hypothetical protein
MSHPRDRRDVLAHRSPAPNAAADKPARHTCEGSQNQRQYIGGLNSFALSGPRGHVAAPSTRFAAARLDEFFEPIQIRFHLPIVEP